MTEPSTTIVVGVEADQNDIVITSALDFARRFDAALVFVTSDDGHYAIGENADGTITSLDIDPDDAEEYQERFTDALTAQITRLITEEDISWQTRAAAGDPAVQLAEIAEELGAVMIIVGTRRSGAWSGVREFLNGSVGARLAHRQHRPVVLVPLHPVADDAELPWRADQ